ncbi:VirB4-like conjugal transfer ATPase, CD1110 family [Solibaculum mannosilyticum]|uniref:VirB4-like conjugal transfer ATPase, CD1110 family n=1 Tax=Solibaculum mannosilyticum TaxID=2780922 RepID=UPI0034BCFF46
MFKRFLRRDMERLTIPRSAQDVIPLRTVYEGGIFEVARDVYSMTVRFSDINYAVASRENKEAMFLGWSEVLNAVSPTVQAKMSVICKKINRQNYERLLIPKQSDGLDDLREEYNRVIIEKIISAGKMMEELYFTFTASKCAYEEAEKTFDRMVADLSSYFHQLGSKCWELSAVDRLKIAHDFYRQEEESTFALDFHEMMRRGHSVKDYICPDSFEFEADCFKMGAKFGRALLLRDYANFLKDSFLSELCSINRNMIVSMDISPISTDQAIKMLESVNLGVETNIANWQRKQNQNSNFSAIIPYDMELQRKESKEFLDDIVARDQRMMLCSLVVVHTADTKEQLDSDTESLMTIARKHLCQLGILRWQQMDGLNTALPFGVKRISAERTLTTESTAVFLPFQTQEVQHEGGIYQGRNAISKNIIAVDRRQLMNGNAFILGVSGSGKSFAAKREIINLVLATGGDVIIIDPEREVRHEVAQQIA